MQTLRASEIHADDSVRLIAIEAVRCEAHKSGPFYRLFARLEPVAIVIHAGGIKRVIGLASAEPSMQELEYKIPELRQLLT